MKKISIVLIILAGLLTLGYYKTDKLIHDKGHKWSYSGENGPDNWKNICGSYSACGGERQSPVNIDNSVPDKKLIPLEVNWTTTSTKIINNGHTVQFNCDAGSTLKANGKYYDLKQFHYHALSEHKVKDKHYPLEVHFVHQANDNNLAVIGIFFKEGAKSQLFEKFLSSFPDKKGEFNSKYSIDLKSLLPTDLSYYTYSGSLTTPPCSEIVEWYVLKSAVTASAEQIKKFEKILKNNNRPVQPLNGRVIKCCDH